MDFTFKALYFNHIYVSFPCDCNGLILISIDWAIWPIKAK